MNSPIANPPAHDSLKGSTGAEHFDCRRENNYATPFNNSYDGVAFSGRRRNKKRRDARSVPRGGIYLLAGAAAGAGWAGLAGAAAGAAGGCAAGLIQQVCTVLARMTVCLRSSMVSANLVRQRKAAWM